MRYRYTPLGNDRGDRATEPYETRALNPRKVRQPSSRPENNPAQEGYTRLASAQRNRERPFVRNTDDGFGPHDVAGIDTCCSIEEC